MPAHGIFLRRFHGGPHAPTNGSIDADELRELILFLGRDRFLPAREWIDRAATGSLREDDLILTFDDNLRCQFDVALPVLADLHISAAFFVCSTVLTGGIERSELDRHFRSTCFDSEQDFHDGFFAAIDASPFCHRTRQALLRFNPRTYLAQFPHYTSAERRFRFVRDEVLGADAYARVMSRMLADRGIDERELGSQLWMTTDHIRALHAAGHVIGLHSHTHPMRLGRLSPQQQREEYTTNWRQIRQITGAAPTAMSHPGDSYVPYTLAILRQLGIRAGFRSNMTQSAYSEFEHPRESQIGLVQRMRQQRHGESRLAA